VDQEGHKSYCSKMPSILLFHLFRVVHCKKRLAFFPSPAGMSLTKLSNREKFNDSRPGRLWLVTSQLGMGKIITFFYSVRSMPSFKSRQTNRVISLSHLSCCSPQHMLPYSSSCCRHIDKYEQQEAYYTVWDNVTFLPTL
jgi:hypothetical protein